MAEDRAPEWLTEEELEELARMESPSAEVQAKWGKLLTTPLISNRAYRQGLRPKRPRSERLGPFLRVAFWNIAGGERLEEIFLALTDPERFLERAGIKPGSARYGQIAEEVKLLQAVDLLILNEVDLGLARSGYRDVARELAEALGMNYAFGVEFVELDRFRLGLETFQRTASASGVGMEATRRERTQERARRGDSQAPRGLHGHAVLSRYPIRRASVFRFARQGFDWYFDEQRIFPPLAFPDRTERTSFSLLQALSFRQMRRGGRMVLLVELSVPDLPEGAVTVVATHLESRARPSVRREQMRELLEHIGEISHPVILAGDFNTSGRDGTPGWLHRALLKLMASGTFWSQAAPKGIPMLGWLNDFFTGLPHLWRIERDPTRRGFMASNEEGGLFEELERFRFRDGRSFDFRGDRTRSARGTTGLLANSNERTRSRFVPTSERAWVFGPVGRRKLDWIFVKPYLGEPRDGRGSYRFAPHFGRTLREVNACLSLSDHHPILVDLPFEEPGDTFLVE